MQKLLGTISRRVLHNKHTFLAPQGRFLLSEAFRLEDVWNDRLQSPILKKINVYDMFYELDNQFQRFAVASAIDIDLFVNAVNDDSSFDEVEDVVHKLRLSPEAINILPSTQHALIRLYIKFNKTNDLIRILDDRLNFGIFSDDYCTLMMMDTLIKEGNFRDAAKISVINILQEDLSNPLIKYMSLYSCHKYLKHPVPWNEENNNNVEQEDDDDEVVKVRVKYIRNFYFDDHFDLVDTNHLIGKTFTVIGSDIDDHIGRTYKLMGLILHDKLRQAKDYVESISATKDEKIVKDGLDTAYSILEKISNSEGKDDSFKALANELRDTLSKSFTSSQLINEGNLLTMAEDRLKDLVNKNENIEIEKQIQLYKEWEGNRQRLLMAQIAKITREKQLAEIQRQKQMLEEKEEEIFFFDNEDKLDLIIEEKEKRKAEQREWERKKEEAKVEPCVLRKIEYDNKYKKKKEIPPLESFFDENIPMKLIKTKL